MVSSIRVKTRCVDRAWHGGCERSERKCTEDQIAALFTALESIYEKVDNCDLNGMEDLKECVKNSHATVVWDCTSPDGAIASSSGDTIKLSPGLFDDGCRFESTVFHEIIHHCGGTELDSEALENHCYSGCTTFGPSSSDFPKFRNDGGNFVDWDPATGELTTKDGQQLNVNESDFVDPDPPADEGWV